MARLGHHHRRAADDDRCGPRGPGLPAAIDHFHLTKERIGAIISQGSEYSNITDYINSLRLDHARELISTRPDMSIDEVSSTSGFSVRRTFSRLFKEKFGLTPTEFREAARAEAKLV